MIHLPLYCLCLDVADDQPRDVFRELFKVRDV